MHGTTACEKKKRSKRDWDSFCFLGVETGSVFFLIHSANNVIFRDTRYAVPGNAVCNSDSGVDYFAIEA